MTNSLIEPLWRNNRILDRSAQKALAVYSAADGELQLLAKLSEEFDRMRNKKREGNEAFSQQNAELNDPRHIKTRQHTK